MKSRDILFISLVVAIALGGALVGLWIGRSGAVQTAMVVESPTVVGEEAAVRRTRLFRGPNATGDLMYEVDGSRVYVGARSRGQTILFFDGRRIYRGANRTGEILFTVSGERIFVGPNTKGSIAYTVKNGRVFEGVDKGPIIYTIRGSRMFRGPNATGAIVMNANTNLVGSIQYLLPILADRRF
ncbi:MAG: hypothetical protein ACE5LU_26090 [Anaerolineae bacterium]